MKVLRNAAKVHCSYIVCLRGIAAESLDIRNQLLNEVFCCGRLSVFNELFKRHKGIVQFVPFIDSFCNAIRVEQYPLALSNHNLICLIRKIDVHHSQGKAAGAQFFDRIIIPKPINRVMAGTQTLQFSRLRSENSKKGRDELVVS